MKSIKDSTPMIHYRIHYHWNYWMPTEACIGMNYIGNIFSDPGMPERFRELSFVAIQSIRDKNKES